VRRREFLAAGTGLSALSVFPNLSKIASAASMPLTTTATVSVPTLPQKASIIDAVTRRAAIASMQLQYVWTDQFPTLPGVPLSALLPTQELPTIEWLIGAISVGITIVANLLGAVATVGGQAVGAQLSSINSQLASARTTLAASQSLFVQAQTGSDATVNALLAGQLQTSLQALFTQLGTMGESALTVLTNALSSTSTTATRTPASYDALFTAISRPEIAGYLHDDAMFAYLRVGGPNPMLLTSISAIPTKFPITNAQYQAALNTTDTLSAALAGKRLFILDYVELGAMAPAGGTSKTLTGTGYVAAPIALFALLPGAATLSAVAIQCGQNPATNPIICRTAASSSQAYWAWQMAKTVVNTADFNYHEMFVHLGRTHLVSEAFCVATHRQLAPNHPLSVLLLPHYEGDIFINELAAAIIMSPDTFGDLILGGPIAAAQQAAARDRLAFDFYNQMPPVDFANRGVASSSVLPEYPYRDDALLIWQALLDWATNYIGVYYKSDADVVGDGELSAWVTEIASSGKILGFRPITSRSQLAQVVAMIMFTASAQHAAVNFPQSQFMVYQPVYSGVMNAPPPSGLSASQQNWNALLPNMVAAIAQMHFLYLLGSVHYRSLGNYQSANFPYLSTLTDPAITATGGPLSQYRAALTAIEAKINAANTTRSYPYPYLLPSRIPTSTNI
jgi:arachidonate 15-lipoxygenase